MTFAQMSSSLRSSIRKEPGSVAEFAHASAAIVACHGTPAALDSINVDPDAVAGRVAPDELLLIGPPQLRADLLTAAAAAVEPVAGIVVDETDAWAILCMLGEGVDDAFRRLSHVSLPTDCPAFLQCSLAHVPCKVIVSSTRLYLFVPAPAAHHVERRLGDACGAGLHPERESVTFADRPVGA
jgi:hypothetical protein